MKNYLFMLLIGASMALFSCGNKEKEENNKPTSTEEVSKDQCAKCGTDECTCPHHVDNSLSCEKCGNAECTCEGHQEEDTKICDKCGMENCTMDHGKSEDHRHEGHEH